MNEKLPEEKSVSKKELKGTIRLLRESLGIYRQKFGIILRIFAPPILLSIFTFPFVYLLFTFTALQYSILLSILEFLLYSFVFLLFSLAKISFLKSLDENRQIPYGKALPLLFPYLQLYFLFLALTSFGLLSIVIAGLSVSRAGSILAVVIALLLLLGVVFYIRFAFAHLVLIFDGGKGFSALWESQNLVRGMFWRIFGRLFLVGLFLGAVFSAIAIPVGLLTSENPDLLNLTLTGTLFSLQMFILPFFLIYTYLLYRSLREAKSEETKTEPSRRFRLALVLPLILGFLFLAFMVGAVVFSIFCGKDEPPPDDKDLILGKVDIPKEQNAYYDILEAEKREFLPRSKAEFQLGKSEHFPPMSKWEELFYDMLAGRRLKTKEASELIERNKGLFECLERASSRPYFQLPQLQEPERYFRSLYGKPALNDLDAMARKGLTSARNIGRWGVIKARFLFAEGDEKSAFEMIFKTINFGKLVENSPVPYVGMVQLLVANIIKTSYTLRALRSMLPKTTLPAGLLKKYVKRLLEYSEDGEGVKRSLKMEYMSNKYALYKFKEKFKFEVLGSIDSLYGGDAYKLASEPFYDIAAHYKQNTTCKLLADGYRILIANVGKAFKDLAFPFGIKLSWAHPYQDFPPPNFLSNLSKEFRDNFEGEVVVRFLVFTIPRLVSYHYDAKLDFIATATLFALKAYKMEKGHLPDSLNELVPQYLPQLPIDPYDGKPLRYSKVKRIIYSVGKDLKDSGGGLGKKGYWTEWQDPTLKIEF